MSQLSHSHGRGQPRCYDSMCGATPAQRTQTDLGLASFFFCFFSVPAFLLVIIFQTTVTYAIWLGIIGGLVITYKNQDEDSKLLTKVFVAITVIIHLLMAWAFL